MSNFIFQRPTDPEPVQHRESVPGKCDVCEAEQLMRYPVLSEGGWYMVVKCQACLHSQSREKAAQKGYFPLCIGGKEDLVSF